MRSSAPNWIKVRYFTSCLGRLEQESNGACHGLKVGDSISYKVSIEVSVNGHKSLSSNNHEFLLSNASIWNTWGDSMPSQSCGQENHIRYLPRGFERENGRWNTAVLRMSMWNCRPGSNPYCFCRFIFQKKFQFCSISLKSYERNSSLCHNGGDLKCGVCQCYGSHFGKTCNCTSALDIKKLENQCKDNGKICSNRGTCQCGKCECFKRPNPKEVSL